MAEHEEVADAGRASVSVAICALTLHRPIGLTSLLDGLARLDVPSDAEISVIIVDNDAEGSAVAVVDAWRDRMPWPLHLVVEPRRGIPFGRNAAVAAAHDADFLAFIDDDEVPDPGWLRELLAMQRAKGADVVTGPVLPRFESSPPSWVTEGGFFNRLRFEDGERLTWATTSSVLIATRVLPAGSPAFNEAMAFTGGSDTHFFMRGEDLGWKMVWADRAVVTELIPTSRVTTRWLLSRQYRRGITLTYCMLDLRNSRSRRVKRVGQGGFQILKGVGLAVVGLPRGRARVVRGLQKVWFGAGLLTALVGKQYEEYRTIHGR